MKKLTNHQSWRAQVIELRLMNEYFLYAEAERIALEVFAIESDDDAAYRRIVLRLGGVVRLASNLESSRVEASVTLAAVRHEVASYFVAERRHFDPKKVEA